MKAHIKTYGCQMNEQDSLQMRGLLSRMGYEPSQDVYEADLILLVTCSVREKAVQKVYSELGRVRDLIEDKPATIVGVAGCVAQQEKGNLFKRFPFLDLVFGPDAIRELPEMIDRANQNKRAAKKERILKTKFNLKKDFEFVNLVCGNEENRIKAFVNIQKGCDNVCSFCIVPHVRGGEVSRPSNEIIQEINSLVEMGVKEVTLLGQNVNSYGLKSSSQVNFVQLIEKIAAQTKLQRLRFMTSHPKDVDCNLIRLFKDIPILCPSFHLPVQSGSDRILKAMRRQYTQSDYLKIIESLKAVRPDMALSTDIIVGFPGEERIDFEETLKLIETVKFDMTFSFIYSPRPQTQSVKLENQISHSEKTTRLKILQTRQRQISLNLNLQLENSIQEVLVESREDFGPHWMGRTGTNKIVHIADPKPHRDLTGEILNVTIKKANAHSLIGVM